MRAPGVELGFALRRTVRWSRGAPSVCAAVADPFGDVECVALRTRADALRRRYDLSALAGRCDRDTFRSNLARLEQLERLGRDLAVPTSSDGVVRAVDFGCGDFHYAAALQQWLSRHGAAPAAPRGVVLRGIELDGFGVYRDGHTRADHARARARAASVAGSTVRFELGDAASLRLPEQDVVTMFFPFLTAYASLAWGSPLSRLRPRRLLRRAVATLRPGGLLLVANQTRREHARLVRLLADQPVRRVARTTFGCELAVNPDALAGQVGSAWIRLEAVPGGVRSG